MAGEVVRVHYYEGEGATPRFIKGILLEDTPDFVKVQMQNYIVQIAKKYVIKLETSRWVD